MMEYTYKLEDIDVDEITDRDYDADCDVRDEMIDRRSE
jgi:hypothetical protein